MKAQIINNPWSSNSEMDKFLNANAGQWVDVDTEHLFTDQYNIEGYRLHDTHLQAVKDDARIGKGKCKYCGKLILAGNLCLNYGECPGHGVEWFNTKTCFFIANPDGVSMPSEFEPMKIGSYTLELNYRKTHWTLRNMRKRIYFLYDGNRFWVVSCGYVGKKFLDVPYEVQRKVILKLKTLQPTKVKT